nr:hypothetical protein [uncultured archaeon]
MFNQLICLVDNVGYFTSLILNAENFTILLNGGLQANHLLIGGILACSKLGRGERSEHATGL